MLGSNKRVLMIGAHPDDEDTELLAILVRGAGAEAGYLALNRGEGGQNLIGSELGEGLGILRTEELLAARRLDGARQYFTRAYDFGFSKTLDDTWAQWPRDSVLKDVVRIVRRLKPQVIVSIFSGTPRDGHGQHQAAGWAALEAFRVAGDSTRFPELRAEEGLAAWTPLKFYRSTRFDSAATTLTLDGDVLDDAVGQTFHQIAMRGRSLHRSQDMGQLQGIGPSTARLRLVRDRTGRGDSGLFAGIDTSLARFEAPAGMPAMAATTVRSALGSYASLAGGLGISLPPGVLAARLRGADEDLRAASSACLGAGCPDALAEALADQRRHLDRARAISSGLLLDATVDDDRAVPGQTLELTVTARNAGSEALLLCSGQLGGADSSRVLAPGEGTQWRLRYTIDAQASPTEPYYLARPRIGDLYAWPPAGTHPGPVAAGDPFAEPPRLQLMVGVPGAAPCTRGFQAFRELTWRANDQSRGEVRRPLLIVPRLDVSLAPGTGIWPLADREARRFVVSVTHAARDTTVGQVRLVLPAGWPAVAPQSFRFSREDERRDFAFRVRPPADRTPGRVEIAAVAEVAGGGSYDRGTVLIDYPHIRPRQSTAPAVAVITRAALMLPKLTTIGYIRGAADGVPGALAEAGLPVELIGHDALESGDLSRYDAIVVGPRAYETDTALVRSNARLLAYVRSGGLVVVQYQQHQYFRGGFPPYPMTVGGEPLRLTADSAAGSGSRAVGPPVSHDRVTDETAPVTIVDPASPVVLAPNRLSRADWEGWIQERGLYFARSWDPHFHPVLEMHDPGDAPLEGGLLIARVGKGTYVYTGLSFFRQLPAGVPGAFRLFANLLALRARGQETGNRER